MFFHQDIFPHKGQSQGCCMYGKEYGSSSDASTVNFIHKQHTKMGNGSLGNVHSCMRKNVSLLVTLLWVTFSTKGTQIGDI